MEASRTKVSNYAYRMFRRLKAKTRHHRCFRFGRMLATYFSNAERGAKIIDSSISKTINVPEGIEFESFKDVYIQAYDSGCKATPTV